MADMRGRNQQEPHNCTPSQKYFSHCLRQTLYIEIMWCLLHKLDIEIKHATGWKQFFSVFFLDFATVADTFVFLSGCVINLKYMYRYVIMLKTTYAIANMALGPWLLIKFVFIPEMVWTTSTWIWQHVREKDSNGVVLIASLHIILQWFHRVVIDRFLWNCVLRYKWICIDNTVKEWNFKYFKATSIWVSLTLLQCLL